MKPAVALFFLAAIVAELMPGATSLLKYINPIVFLFLTSLYGASALLCREATIRWGKGWPTLVTLGVVYGILNEGICAKSYFDPGWKDIGFLGHYGRALGVNWIWVMRLSIYHSLISIVTPIVIVEMIYPASRNKSWVSLAGIKKLVLLLIGVSVVLHLYVSPFRPPLVALLGALAAMAGFIWLARRLPREFHIKWDGTFARPRTFFWMGFGMVFLFFNLPNESYETHHVPAWMAAGLLAGAAWILGWLLARWSGNFTFGDRSRLGLIAGPLAFFALFSLVHEIKGGEGRGMTLVGAATLAGLFWLRRRIERGGLV